MKTIFHLIVRQLFGHTDLAEFISKFFLSSYSSIPVRLPDVYRVEMMYTYIYIYT